MPITAQVTMSWDGTKLIVEAANPKTGAREKLDMVGFHDLPDHIQFTLSANLQKAKDHYENFRTQIEQSRENNRLAREREIAENNRRDAVEREARWQKYIEDLNPHVRAYHEHKRALRAAKSAETAKQIYGDIAVNHGVPLANRVIDPSRRPKRIEMTKNGNKVTYYPRTDDTDATKKAKKNAKKNGAVVHTFVDTSTFTF